MCVHSFLAATVLQFAVTLLILPYFVLLSVCVYCALFVLEYCKCNLHVIVCTVSIFNGWSILQHQTT